MTEKPVEKQVNLREEKISRGPSARRSCGQTWRDGNFKEGQIELTEKREEPVVNKAARVVEEVRVGKDVNEQTETVRDTVRRKDVRVEETGGTHADYDEDLSYRLQDSGMQTGDRATITTLRHISSAAHMLTIQRYRDRDWNVVESDLRRDWETRGQGKWEDFKDCHPIWMGSRPRPPLNNEVKL